ncbi:glycoside hydrolase family 19 protein [Pseudoalteromonas luteoviolacea]|uniref:Lytic enzyme n=1 Tax=Pseudoalteromonas luteoviolacea S4060-1 TaxID=1365257 RepID=A0A167NDP4_9GAMM|nr:glycoside hydrolase family 19 protein [Pseudoalteromonas luteoviolacea]KZN68050.1 lytic enzyme [Pseudoalteromonas luteoviolacea S4060-1]
MAISLTLDLLAEIMPQAKTANIEKYVTALNEVLPTFEINTPLRIAHFVAQVAHESGYLNYNRENLNYSQKALRAVFGKYFPNDDVAGEYARQPEKIANRVYADRMGNGDEASGDGWRYRGRGLIQLTGKDNYTRCGEALGLDLTSNPDLVSDDATIAIQSACHYWQSCNLNSLADQDDLLKITKRINGGTNGLEDRTALLNRAKQFLEIA